MRIDTDLESYITNHTTHEDEVLTELTRQTYLSTYNPRMLSGVAQGRFLEFICRMLKPKRILEIGTFTGYSAICMARGAMPNVHIDTIEVNDELEEVIRSFLARANVQNHVHLHIGDANAIINKLDGGYDLVFIDGEKREYPDYYLNVMPKVNVGGFVIADNVLWDGKVYHNEHTDQHTEAVRKFNAMVQSDANVENTILPVRDGLMFIRKIR